MKLIAYKRVSETENQQIEFPISTDRVIDAMTDFWDAREPLDGDELRVVQEIKFDSGPTSLNVDKRIEKELPPWKPKKKGGK